MNKIFNIFGKKQEQVKNPIIVDFMELNDLDKRYKSIVKKYQSKLIKELESQGFGSNAKKFKIFNNDTSIHKNAIIIPIISEITWDIFPNGRNLSDREIQKYTIDIPLDVLNKFNDTMLKEINNVDRRFTFKAVATSESYQDIEATYISEQYVIEG